MRRFQTDLAHALGQAQSFEVLAQHPYQADIILAGRLQAQLQAGIAVVFVAQHNVQELDCGIATAQDPAQFFQQAFQRKQQGLAMLYFRRQLQPRSKALRRLEQSAGIGPYTQQAFQVIGQAGAETPGQCLAGQAQQVAQLAKAHAFHGGLLRGVQLQAVQRQGAELLAYGARAVDMQAFRASQPGGFRRRGGTRDGVITKLSQLAFEAAAQILWASEQAFTGACFQKQPGPVARDAHLVAVLVAPGRQAPQGLLFGFGITFHHLQALQNAQRRRHRHAGLHAAGQRSRVAVDDQLTPPDGLTDRDRQPAPGLPAGLQVQGQVREAYAEPARGRSGFR